jgi:hypothetical protein
MSTSVFLTQIHNQTIMVKLDRKKTTAFISASKLIKLVLTFFICRYIQLFPPQAEAVFLSEYFIFNL